MQQEDPKAEILEAMRMTDKHKKGYILASELRAKLTGLGEKLTDKEGIHFLYLAIYVDVFIRANQMNLAKVVLLFCFLQYWYVHLWILFMFWK